MKWDIIWFVAFILHVLVCAFVWSKISKRISNKLCKRVFTVFIILIFLILFPFVVIGAPYEYVYYKNHLVQYITRESNKRHPITLGENQRITIHIKNPFPVKMDYGVYTYLRIKDGLIRVYPHMLEKDFSIVNRSEKERFQTIAGMRPDKGTIYPIRMHITGYTLNSETGEKEIFFQDDMGNHQTSEPWGHWDGRDYDFSVPMDGVYGLSRGEYYFDIEDVSKKIDFFDEIEASVQIAPLDEAIH